MNTLQNTVFLFLLLTVLPPVFAQQRQQPKIGYVYPAGGQQGTTFRVILGGRQVARSTGVFVSGNGVSGKIVFGGNTVINNGEQNRVARYLFDNRRFELGLLNQKPKPPVSTELMPLPKPEEIKNRYLLFNGIDSAAAEDLQLIYYWYFMPRPDPRPGDALNQAVQAEITIDADAEPGSRDLRLLTNGGLTPPVRFIIGTNYEVKEIEPNEPAVGNEDTKSYSSFSPFSSSFKQLPAQKLPVVFNGQIYRGDVDRFFFEAGKGQKLVVRVRARYLMPYLADGVPGWFQPVITIYDSSGEKCGESYSYRFDPDPVILFDVPKNDVYSIEIQDTVYRGRPDFVYRISVDESPFVTSVFPLGGSTGRPAAVDIQGWNLPAKVATLKTEKAGVFELTKIGKTSLPFPIRYAVDDLPETFEKESNNSVSLSQKVKLPVIVNGRINTAADTDYFTFNGKKGSKIVLDVSARSLNSPLDASIELLDSTGKILAANDDRSGSDGPNIGLETHHADPYILAELPADGIYTVRLFNVLQQGGTEYGYRLRISPPQMDVAVYAEPASIYFSGREQPLKLTVIRKDGFDENIKVELTKSSKEKGFELTASDIPKGKDSTTAMLKATAYTGQLTDIDLEAVITVNGKELRRKVIAVDDWEQAFIYHHLVPASSLNVAGQKRYVPPRRDGGK
ncbi:MAG: PPC domain-containing protein [Planctomycetaceae bacterium]|jgi:hypothetical protein|nr:PPC domain-containing protein [Planctomycetaceae bacterium]